MIHYNASIKQVLSEREAAEYINMSRSFLRHARIDGPRQNRTPAPKFIKIGRSIRYPLEELNAFLAQFPRKSHIYSNDETVEMEANHAT